MNYKQIEELINTDGGLLDLLENYKDTFDKLESYAKNLETSKLQSSDIQNLLLRSTGIWGSLNVVCTIVDTSKRNKELEFYHQAKMNHTEGKFMVSATKEEASATVQTERRVRNVFEAYKNMAEKNILSCQSYLKYLTESFKRNSYQQG